MIGDQVVIYKVVFPYADALKLQSRIYTKIQNAQSIKQKDKNEHKKKSNHINTYKYKCK